jgi:hypothetical protein
MKNRLVKKAPEKYLSGIWRSHAIQNINNQKLQCALTGMPKALKRWV